jgi:hypothetical protein
VFDSLSSDRLRAAHDAARLLYDNRRAGPGRLTLPTADRRRPGRQHRRRHAAAEGPAVHRPDPNSADRPRHPYRKD